MQHTTLDSFVDAFTASSYPQDNYHLLLSIDLVNDPITSCPDAIGSLRSLNLANSPRIGDIS